MPPTRQDQNTVQVVKRPRWEVARELIAEYFHITRRKVDWPRSNVQLENLKKIIEVLRKKKLVHEELSRGSYIVDEGFDGADKYFKYIPRGKQNSHFVVNDNKNHQRRCGEIVAGKAVVQSKCPLQF